jgi:predicted DNA-binding protein
LRSVAYITLTPRCIIDAVERTQISLEKEQAERLRRLAHERGVSMSHLIREAVDRAYGPDGEESMESKWERARSAIGSFRSGEGDIARDHDRYLDEIYGS